MKAEENEGCLKQGNCEVKTIRRKKKRKGYFYEEEENAFKDYLTTEDKYKRDLIFQKKLYPAFTKMIESIIRRYGLYTPEEEYEDTFNDVLSFLMTKIENFDFTKGNKLYSYSGTICKNYLIMKRVQAIKNTNRSISYENFFNENNPDLRIADDGDKDNVVLNRGLIKEVVTTLEDVLDNPKKHGLKENEIKIGNSILDMLDNWETIFTNNDTTKFNKTSVLYYLKENTFLTTKEIRDTMKKFKNLYKSTKMKYLAEKDVT